MNNREAIEYFHLSFSNRLASKVSRDFFCLKGGCNLRFYFQSIRYSEDIDFDVHTTSLQTLKKNVEKIISDDTFRSILKHQNIEIVEWSAPKQTPTTQRWKLALKLDNQSLTLHTKIEFSRRIKAFSDSEVQFVTPSIISRYKLQPVLLQHYRLNSAIEQKIKALIDRTETQVRDVVDLKTLKDQLSGSGTFAISKEHKAKALETLMSISFSDFKSQVWPYLMSDYQAHYENKKAWEQLQVEVLAFIEKQTVLR
jgi:predicted nucleotidyltransferase component of viral defense system